ncbi:class I lanthipeptide [Tahibacter soli]|jgi:hypothetical protein|uniref:Class I lanthipeptide n=1 Tax=Tahibacter soli TaxID=2983605 RepID=A0A9X3YPL5_9GAMM|nr:class I lanthipeptide [Tahibacter soli]MDC8015634.1 class I lanthipeptide [Tahibacter soli]
MKKISLSKETLRVLTAQEAEQVAGGLPPSTIPEARCPAPISNPEPCNPPTYACPTNGCPPYTTNCPATTNCPPPQTSPTRPQARCPACPL